MKIAVNTRLLLKGKLEGIGRFSYEVLKRLTIAHPEHEFIFIFDRTPSKDFLFSSNVKAVVARPPARHPILWFLFFEFGVYRVLKREKPDVFFSPDGWISMKSKVPTLNVIHDLNFEVHPEFLPKRIVSYYKKYFPIFATKSRRLISVSEYTKKSLTELYGIPEDKIDVVYNAASSDFQPLEEKKQDEIRKKYSGNSPYFLFVGLIHPRKNLENQLQAFEAFKKKAGSEHKFLVVGDKYSTTPELDLFLNSSAYAKDVIFLGRLEFTELSQIYGAAYALMYVSYFEGFGIPIVEAMNVEIPVITSTTSSMPEVVGDAGLIADPDNSSEISKCMLRLYHEPNLRSDLINRGRERRLVFNWDDSANRVMKSIIRVGDSNYRN